jgi:hypothetical protein
MTILFVIAAIVISGCALSVAIDVWNIRRELLPDIRKILLTTPRTYTGPDRVTPSSIHLHQSFLHRAGFFVIWEWALGEWAPMTELIPPGVHPGLPPSYPGTFNGEKVKTWVSTS